MHSPRLLFETFCQLAVATLQVRLLPYRWWRQRLRGAFPSEQAIPVQADLLTAFVHVARRFPGSRNCLIRSLALQALLRHRGLPARIRFGARRENGRWAAHAWVECGVQVLDGPDGARFHELTLRRMPP